MPNDEIVFEDLRGVEEQEAVTVDLDSDLKDAGIERTPADKAADAGDREDDDIQIDDLRTADRGAEDDSDDEDDASSDGEEDGYSRKVKARIDREARAKRKAQDEASYWRTQAEQLAKDRAGRDKAELESTVERTSSAIHGLEADLERAIEDGNTKDQVKFTSQLTDLKAEKIQAELALKDLPSDVQLQPFDDKVSADDDTNQSLADKWMSDRADWYGARGFERQTRLANRLDREVFADGYDPKSKEYFEELDRRIKEKEPNLFDDDDKGSRRQRRQSPVAPVSGAEPTRRQSSSKVELGEDDFANMRRFGLDTNDPQVLKEYARNKRETLGGRR